MKQLNSMTQPPIKLKTTDKQKTLLDDLFIVWFEKYLESVYKMFYNKDGTLVIKESEAHVNCTDVKTGQMTLDKSSILDFWHSNMPALLIFYHEIGHVLYTTKQIQSVCDYIVLSTTKQILMNWLEDFYIEKQLINTMPFVAPYIKMLHNIKPKFIDDFEKPEYAFHYYYLTEGLTPNWMIAQKIDKKFKQYIKQLLSLRNDLSIKLNRDKFINIFNEFYDFCVYYKIYTFNTPPKMNLFQIPDHLKKINQMKIKTTNEYQKLLQQDINQNKTKNNNHNNYDNSQTINDQQNKNKDNITIISYEEFYDKLSTQTEFDLTEYEPFQITNEICYELKQTNNILNNIFQKTISNFFKPNTYGKPTITLHTINTTSPRTLIDPIAIETMRDDFYLEYAIEKNKYLVYNLFIDTSGSVGFDKIYNNIAKNLIQSIISYTHNIYFYESIIRLATPNEIANIDNLCGDGGTCSELIGSIIEKKKKQDHLNIVLTDGDLNNFFERNDLKELIKQHLFIFIYIHQTRSIDNLNRIKNKAKQYLLKGQYYIICDNEDLFKGLQVFKNYMLKKGV